MKNGRIEVKDILAIPSGGSVVFNINPVAAITARSLIYQTALRHHRDDVKQYSTNVAKDEFGKTIIGEDGNVRFSVTAVPKK